MSRAQQTNPKPSPWSSPVQSPALMEHHSYCLAIAFILVHTKAMFHYYQTGLKHLTSIIFTALYCSQAFTVTHRQTSVLPLKMSNTIDHPSDARGVIFDIDGTLADSWKLGFDATQVVLDNNNIPRITEELYHECTRYCTPDRLARHAGFLPSDGEQFKSIGEKLGREFDVRYVLRS